jgi:hypothetical protein
LLAFSFSDPGQRSTRGAKTQARKLGAQCFGGAPQDKLGIEELAPDRVFGAQFVE